MAQNRQNQSLSMTFWHKRARGNLGEDIACKYLENKDFTIVCRNFQRKYGELDIVAERDNITHFLEVKSVVASLESSKLFRPEENVHDLKIMHIKRMIQVYLSSVGKANESEFQFHVLCVFMDMRQRRARVKWIENVII